MRTLTSHSGGLVLADSRHEAPPKAKKRKTEQPEEVGDDEGVEGADDEEDAVAAPGEYDEEDGEEEPGDDDEEEADETAKGSGPAASAKAAKGNTVPKESNLEEIEAAEEDD